VNGMQIGDKTVQVSTFLKQDERTPAEITNYTNLYIKNIPDSWDEDKLKEVFGPFGEISSHVLQEDANKRKFAFVAYASSESAVKCVGELHGKDFRTDEEKAKAEEAEQKDEDGGALYVQRFKPKAERIREFKKMQPAKEPASGPAAAQGVNLYIKNLDESTDDEALKGLFEPFGTITSAKAMMDEKDKCKGFGFVSFASPDEATKAVTEMHLKVIKGKPLYVGLAEKKEVRAERLRNRYTAAPMGGKGKGKGKGMMAAAWAEV